MHIDITLAKGQPATVLVDGVDIAKHVTAAEFTVGVDEHLGPVVNLQLKPDTLTLDLDDPAVAAAIAFLECPEPRCRAQRGHQGRHVLADSPFPGQPARSDDPPEHVACTSDVDCQADTHILACPGRR